MANQLLESPTLFQLTTERLVQSGTQPIAQICGDQRLEILTYGAPAATIGVASLGVMFQRNVSLLPIRNCLRRPTCIPVAIVIPLRHQPITPKQRTLAPIFQTAKFSHKGPWRSVLAWANLCPPVWQRQARLHMAATARPGTVPPVTLGIPIPSTTCGAACLGATWMLLAPTQWSLVCGQATITLSNTPISLATRRRSPQKSGRALTAKHAVAWERMGTSLIFRRVWARHCLQITVSLVALGTLRIASRRGAPMQTFGWLRGPTIGAARVGATCHFHARFPLELLTTACPTRMLPRAEQAVALM